MSFRFSLTFETCDKKESMAKRAKMRHAAYSNAQRNDSFPVTVSRTSITINAGLSPQPAPSKFLKIHDYVSSSNLAGFANNLFSSLLCSCLNRFLWFRSSSQVNQNLQKRQKAIMVGTNFMDELDCGSFFDHIDDLLDVPSDDLDTDLLVGANGDRDSFPSIFPGCSPDGFIGSDSVFSANSASDLSAELSVPYEDIVQLEWLSNFVEDSFSGGGMTMEKNNISSTKDNSPSQGHFQTSSPVSVLESCSSSSNGKTIPVNHEKKARSKRTRPTTFIPRPAMQLISPTSSLTETLDPTVIVPCTSSESGTTSVESRPLKKAPKQAQADQPKKKKLKIVFPSNPEDAAQKQNPSNGASQAVRKCLHCEITKTPQWRAGPLGPKTLCNACGVRYKSGRLFPEYRPAASPTFIPSIHSNSHKKVIEMRSSSCLKKSDAMPKSMSNGLEIAAASEEPELIPRSDLLPTCV